MLFLLNSFAGNSKKCVKKGYVKQRTAEKCSKNSVVHHKKVGTGKKGKKLEKIKFLVLSKNTKKMREMRKIIVECDYWKFLNLFFETCQRSCSCVQKHSK